jgi:LysR family transcriptional regulator, hypochlorite-specific transcription factor HypT
MELKWIDDFLKLAETGSFSRAADARYVTQPAFSRRIKALEAWLGVELVDRSTFPTRLTRAGEQFKLQAMELQKSILEARAIARGLQNPTDDTLHFAATHTMSLTFFPHWLAEMASKHGKIKSKLTAGNVHDAITMLAEGHCDLLLSYHHDSLPIELEASRYEKLLLGSETLAPYAKADGNGKPMHSFPGHERKPVPYLAYTPGAYLGRMVSLSLQHSPNRCYLDCVYETDMAEALKVMVLEGQGVAWLPASSVVRELQAGRIVPCGDASWQIAMETHLYRDKNNQRKSVKQFWDKVCAEYQQAA